MVTMLLTTVCGADDWTTAEYVKDCSLLGYFMDGKDEQFLLLLVLPQ